MIKQLLSLASIVFMILCIGAIVLQFVPAPSVWEWISDMYHLFDNEGTLEIESMPEGAAVYINGEHIGQTPLRKTYEDGTYDVKVLLSGYQTYARKIAIEKQNTSLIRAKLSKEYGAVHITSTPSNAVVYLDGKRQGQLTPLDLKLEQGRYFIKIEKDRFYSIEEEVIVEQGKTRTVEVELLRQVGRVVLETTPPGAKAYIGEDLIGTTPFTHDKPVGKYVITLKKPKFRDKILEAVIAPDETLNINIDMTERMGALKITTNPPGAEVHINDAYQGESPVTIEKKPGSFQLTLVKQGYREVKEELVIEDNITKNIHRDLDPMLGEIRIDSDPAHANVWLNSESIGFTPIRINKPPGIYTVRITKPGYKNYAEEIHVKGEAFIQLHPVLEKDQL